MKFDFVRKQTCYEGCTSGFEEAEIVLTGAGYDGSASYRPGAGEAPHAIRKDTLLSQENYSPYFEIDLTEKAVHDMGDIEIVPDNKTLTLKRIHELAHHLFSQGKRICLIGGEHLVSLPAIEAATEVYPELRIVQLDAHLDLMDELFGETLSHGTVMRRVYDIFRESGRIYQVGIRSGSRQEYRFAHKQTCLYPFGVEKFIKDTHKLADFPIYLTLDVDVFDPALLPGTGTPEAGGIFFPEYLEFLKAMQGLNIIGCDLVELAPPLDPGGTSTIVAAKVLRELLIAL
ncbi:MAG: agmatinase [Calditrichia bacterium]